MQSTRHLRDDFAVEIFRLFQSDQRVKSYKFETVQTWNMINWCTNTFSDLWFKSGGCVDFYFCTLNLNQ